MIVNTAYIYMGSGGGGGEPANPNLWQDGVANYPVEFTNSSISADGLLLNKNSTATFSELQLTDFANLKITGNNGQFLNIEIKFEFFDSSDQLLGTRSATFPPSTSTSTRTVEVPSKARIKNAKIKITNTTRYSVTLISAVLS